MSGDRYTPEYWQQQYLPVANWDDTYRQRQWDQLDDLSQAARHAIIAGYVHKLVSRGHILDAGCGEGALIGYLDSGRIEYTGFDISPIAIQRAKERHPNARLLARSIEEFVPPNDLQYDVVIFNDSLATLKTPIEMIDRYLDFLCPTGFVILSQFQPIKSDSNGALLTRLFEAELAAGRYEVAVRSEVLNPDTDRKWRTYCLTKGSKPADRR